MTQNKENLKKEVEQLTDDELILMYEDVSKNRKSLLEDFSKSINLFDEIKIENFDHKLFIEKIESAIQSHYDNPIMIEIDEHADLLKIIEKEILNRRSQELHLRLLKNKERKLKEDQIDFIIPTDPKYKPRLGDRNAEKIENKIYLVQKTILRIKKERLQEEFNNFKKICVIG